MFRRRQKHISKALIQQHLKYPDSENDSDLEEADHVNGDIARFLPDCPSEGKLLECRSWLQQRCDQEQCRLEELLADDAHCKLRLESVFLPGYRDRRDSFNALDGGSNLRDTAVLERIRDGRGPRGHCSEDLLATLRDAPVQKHGTQWYGDPRSVLLAWNKRVSQGLEEDEGARDSLKAAIERRAHLLKAPARGSDKSRFLEESSAELLQALTAMRPEIADFEDQELLDVLVIMWANIRIAIPDLDDELKLLTMTALINEVESKSHTSNTVKLSSIARSLSVARLQMDPDEVECLEKKMQAFEKKLRETAAKKVIDKIKTGRRELTAVKLMELQQLTELQAAQKWATYTALGSSQQMQMPNRACDQADGRLQRVLQHQTIELDVHIQAVQSNTNALAGMSADLLSRATEAGFALEDKTSSASNRLANEDMKAYVTGGIADILNAREQAARMLEHMDAVDSHLEMMLDAAKNKYRAYDDVLPLVEQAENQYEEEIRVAEDLGFGARRESILLMCRNLQRAKQALRVLPRNVIQVLTSHDPAITDVANDRSNCVAAWVFWVCRV
ncbi:hypothetical protein N0V87_002902 [Didymella glomerata]|uniref:Uncharacterized protein n=1 Tax=Didymella glomerata TaxID=749621 RepID=A0A9W8X4X7_9PLEO|nr:hypothetical protein N0V87_002902 [Didymella glomerata]